MVTIVRRSAAIVTFVGLLTLGMSSPQKQHLERFADLLVVAPKRKKSEKGIKRKGDIL